LCNPAFCSIFGISAKYIRCAAQGSNNVQYSPKVDGRGNCTNRLLQDVKKDAVDTKKNMHILSQGADYIIIFQIIHTKLRLLLLIVWKTYVGYAARSVRNAILYLLQVPFIIFTINILILLSNCLDLISSDCGKYENYRTFTTWYVY
jgi:hypothetical protein